MLAIAASVQPLSDFDGLEGVSWDHPVGGAEREHGRRRNNVPEIGERRH